MRIATNVTRESLGGITQSNINFMDSLDKKNSDIIGIELNTKRLMNGPVVFQHLPSEYFNHNIISIYDILPSSFTEGISELSKHKYFYLYPIFWQWFLWGFGGFIMLDKKEEELKLLSNKTGIPVDEVENALKVYNILFPTKNNNWFVHTF